MIELRGVTKTFGIKKAVDHLDLGVRAGELFAFLGPNGAGKTTTIKMVCGLLRPTSGEVRVGGFPAASSQARQMIAYVPDQPYLYEKTHRSRVPPVRGRDVRPGPPRGEPQNWRPDRHLRDERLRG